MRCLPKSQREGGLLDIIGGAQPVSPASKVACDEMERGVWSSEPPEARKCAVPWLSGHAVTLEESYVGSGTVEGLSKIFGPAFDSAPDMTEAAACDPNARVRRV